MMNLETIVNHWNKKNFIRFWTMVIAVSGAAGILVGYLSGCVTVNVNFPESAVQSATDDYVKDLYRAKEKSRLNSPEAKPSSSGSSSVTKPQAFIWGIDFEFIHSAHAAETSFSLKFDSPKERELQAKLASSLSQVDAEKSSGNLGEGSDGFLVIKTEKPILKKKLEPLVHETNATRKELYQEVVGHQGLSKYSLKDIQENFARSFRSSSPRGSWVQNPDGSWVKK